MSLFRNNVEACEGFAEACGQVLELDAKTIDPATCSDEDLLKLMTAAIGKWLSALVRVHAPSRVELASTHAYQVDPLSSQEDLVSLALRVEPIIAASPDPLSPTRLTPEDECATAIAILRRSAHRRNVDAILEQEVVREELIRETEGLLEDARYDVSGYRAWLES